MTDPSPSAPFSNGVAASLRLVNAHSYDEWKRAAQQYDEQTGAAKWRTIERSRLYDFEVIRRRLGEVRAARTSGDPHRLLFYLNEGIHGNMGGMGNPALYGRARFGTKDLIRDYIGELTGALQDVAVVPDSVIPFRDRLEFFRRASRCFGRSALMLSGAGALGPFHIGVVKALLEQDLLPDVISGASAGSFIAAIVGCHDAPALKALFSPDGLIEAFAAFADDSRKVATGSRIGIEDLRKDIAARVPDLTFEEAFRRTGRKINISVSPLQYHQRSRMLNAVTSPNVFIREAVLASCAIPGVFPAVTLAAKNVKGERQPYIPARKWVDGSITGDLPIDRLTRLYGVNHFIASQTNPLVLWALSDRRQDDSIFGRSVEIYQRAVKEWFRATYPLAMRLTRDVYPLNIVTRMGYGLATQDYTADINIIPQRRLWDPRKLLSVLSDTETQELISEGEASTWPKIEMIRNCTLISRTIDDLLLPLERQAADGTPHPQAAIV
ncbi:MAG: DUF3336 domain-containing protein [Pseudomonadales bacterium]|nr:DUF3336 domain-containing protein [Pseudomonadales bacterium]